MTILSSPTDVEQGVQMFCAAHIDQPRTPYCRTHGSASSASSASTAAHQPGVHPEPWGTDVMLVAPHPLDPNLLDFGEDYEHRIYAPNMDDYAVVDAVDYWHFSRYCWSPKTCRAGKWYLRRAVAVWENKVLTKTMSVYLHVEIQKRVGPPPTPHHRKVDHRNGDERNCRRSNLRWATDVMNNRNRFGSMADQEELL